MNTNISTNKQKEVQVKVKGTKKRKTIADRRDNKFGYLFILPFLLVFITFNLYPIFRTLYLSFTNYKGFGEMSFIGVDNYTRLLGDEMFRKALFNTVRIWSVNIVLQLGLALILTIVFSDIKYKMKGLSLFRALFYLPNLMAATSIAFLFNSLLDWQRGSLNQLLSQMGIMNEKVNWLGNPGTAALAVSVILAWMWFGNSFIVLMAGVQGISKDYYEAAYIDGAGRWTVLYSITLPLLKPILLFVAVTSLIGGLQMFDIPFLITDGIGAPYGALNTMVMYLYNTAFKFNNVGYAAAIAYGLFIIIGITSVITFKAMNKKGKEA